MSFYPHCHTSYITLKFTVISLYCNSLAAEQMQICCVHETLKWFSSKTVNLRETTQCLFRHTYPCKKLRATRAPRLENYVHVL